METTLIGEDRQKDWNSYIQENPFSIAWQVFDWYRIVNRHHRVQFLPLAAMNGTRIEGILPLYKLKTLKGGSALISVPYAVAGGILADDPEVRDALLAHATRLMKEQDCTRIILKQYKIRIEGDLNTDENYYNRELNLTQSESDLLTQFSEVNREVLDRTEKDRWTLSCPTDDINGFYNVLHKYSRDRGVPCVAKGWITDLIDLGMYSVAQLRNGDGRSAFTMVKKYKDTVSFPFTCATGIGEDHHPIIYMLYWELIRRFKDEGYRIFHSGRIPANDDTDPFRLGWGGVRNGYYYQYYPNTSAKTEFAVRRSPKRKAFETVWKKTPLWITKTVSPFIIRQFP